MHAVRYVPEGVPVEGNCGAMTEEAASCQLAIASCQLPVASCQLPVASCWRLLRLPIRFQSGLVSFWQLETGN